MKDYTFTNIVDAYTTLLEDLISCLDFSLEVRGSSILEIPDSVSVTWPNTENMKNVFIDGKRKLSLGFLEGELLWILAGSNKVEDIVPFNKRWADFSDDSITLYGAYGYRLKDQLLPLIQKLKNDIYTRQAVVTIYNQNDISAITKDVPCNDLLQFKIRKDSSNELRLNTISYCRSNDIILGFPYDVFHWQTIQKLLVNSLKDTYPGLKVGSHTHVVGSLHLYERDLDKALAIVSQSHDDIEKASYCFNVDLSLEEAIQEAKEIFINKKFNENTIFKNAKIKSGWNKVTVG